MSLVSTFRWNCNLLPKFGKTQSHLINCVLFICSFFQLISNPINWILFFTYSIVKFHSHSLECWSVWMDSNHRPRAYQARALATWATDRFFLRLFSSSISQGFILDGGDEGIRTLDPLLAGQVLSQLSYTPIVEVRGKSEKWIGFALLFSFLGFVLRTQNWILTIEQQIL